MEKTREQIEQELKEFLHSSYPEIDVRVQPFRLDASRAAIFFTEQKFSLLYPQQRFHYLTQLIPADYQEKYLEHLVWFELAPGEQPEELVYPDEEQINSITQNVMHCLQESGFFEALDQCLCPFDDARPPAACYGDYRVSRSILPSKGFSEDEYFDIFHVLMAQGGFCDCEILYNVTDGSRLRAEYWSARVERRKPYDPHGAT